MADVAVHRLQILAAALLFSTGGAAIKAVTLSPWQVAGFRSGVAALVLLAVLPRSRRFWRPGLLLVGTAYASTMILFVAGNKMTTAANTIFLQSTAPLYLILLGPWLLREPVRRSDRAFIVCLAVGLALFFLGTEPARATAPRPALGNLLGACAGVGWALTIAGLRWLGRRGEGGPDSAAAAVVAGNLVACLCCMPFAWPVAGARPADWALIGYLGVFQIALAYVFMTRGVRGVGALELSLLILVEPVLNSFWAWLAHGERPGPWSLAGCAVILASTLVFTLRRR
jgi:drug/metabolite transporter (DMT)-like permease